MIGAWDYFWSPWGATPKVKQVNAAEQLFGIVPRVMAGISFTITADHAAKLLVFGNAAAIAIALGSGYPMPFWFMAENTGVGVATFTAAGGSAIDGAGTFILNQNKGAILTWDGTNFFTMRGGS